MFSSGFGEREALRWARILGLVIRAKTRMNNSNLNYLWGEVPLTLDPPLALFTLSTDIL